MAEKTRSSTDKSEEIKQITERLEAGIKNVFESEKYRDYLNTMSKFHNYSFRNSMLIYMQKPDATLVAGFNSWRDNFGRSVNKGETGIRILAYTPYKITKDVEKLDKETGLPILDKNGVPVMEQVESTIPYFKPVSVFDVSQTNGKELPQIATDLNGEIDNYDKFMDVLREVSPVPIKFEEITTGSHGFYSRETNDITVKEGMSQAQTVKTTIHEIAHAMLHNGDNDDQKDKNTREVEAESIAYTVCQHFGIDSSDYSFGYVAGWSKDKELPELQASLETIRETASTLITAINEKYLGLEKSRDMPEKQAEQKSESQIIGNTPYKYIKDKQYVKVPSADTAMVEEFLKSEGIKYSGRKMADFTTFTVSSANLYALREFVHDVKYTKEINQYLMDKQDFSIYQLKSGDEYHGIRFESFESNRDKSLTMSDYNLVYTGNWDEIGGNTVEDKLDAVYDKFNNNIPEDFKGHSLSVSDVIVVGNTAHYVDDMGFTEMPDFFKEKQIQQTQQSEQVEKAAKQMPPAQDMPEVKITIPENGIIGNTPYKNIANKHYIKMSADEAIKAAGKLEASGLIKYSGRIIGDKATLTIDSEDEPLFRALTLTPEEIMSQTKSELQQSIIELEKLNNALDDAEFALRDASRRYCFCMNPANNIPENQKQAALDEMKQAVRDMDAIQEQYDNSFKNYSDVSERFHCLLQAKFKSALDENLPQVVSSMLSAEEWNELAEQINFPERNQIIEDKTREIFSGENEFSINGENTALEKFAQDYIGKDNPIPNMTAEMPESGEGVVFSFSNISVAITSDDLSKVVMNLANERATALAKTRENQDERSDRKQSLSERIGEVKKNPCSVRQTQNQER